MNFTITDIAITVGTATIVFVLVGLMIANIKASDAVTAGSAVEGHINNTEDVMDEVTGTWFPLWGTFAGLAVVVVVGFGVFAYFRMR